MALTIENSGTRAAVSLSLGGLAAGASLLTSGISFRLLKPSHAASEWDDRELVEVQRLCRPFHVNAGPESVTINEETFTRYAGDPAGWEGHYLQLYCKGHLPPMSEEDESLRFVSGSSDGYYAFPLSAADFGKAQAALTTARYQVKEKGTHGLVIRREEGEDPVPSKLTLLPKAGSDILAVAERWDWVQLAKKRNQSPALAYAATWGGRPYSAKILAGASLHIAGKQHNVFAGFDELPEDLLVQGESGLKINHDALESLNKIKIGDLRPTIRIGGSPMFVTTADLGELGSLFGVGENLSSLAIVYSSSRRAIHVQAYDVAGALTESDIEGITLQTWNTED